MKQFQSTIELATKKSTKVLELHRLDKMGCFSSGSEIVVYVLYVVLNQPQEEAQAADVDKATPAVGSQRRALSRPLPHDESAMGAATKR
jgi:hypothetical protein